MTSLADRGDTGPTSRVLADITSVISSQLPSPAPLFLMGHSLGGAETLYYAAKGPAEIRQQIVGYLAESPWIALYHATQPSWLKVFAGRLAARVVPKWHLTERVNLPWVTRDKEVVKALAEDDLCHDTGTLEGFAGCFDRSGELDSGAIVLKDSEGAGGKARLWLGHGTEDRVTSFEASKRFVERQHVEDKEFKIYEGWFHQRELFHEAKKLSKLIKHGNIVHSEPGDDKITFANDVANWIIARSHRVSDKI